MPYKKILTLTAAGCLFIAASAGAAEGVEPQTASPATPIETRSEKFVPGQDYMVQPGDVLQISVWKEAELLREVIVRPDGGVSFPLAGDIKTTGMTVPMLEKELTNRIRKYIPEAVVSVAMKLANGYRFYVVGRVNRPGEFPTVRPIDVMQALALAGGATQFASLNNIKILRRVNGVETSIPFRYGRVQKGKSLKENIILQSGDVVVVP